MKKILVLSPPRKDGVVMVKEGRCIQQKDAWSYVTAPITMVLIGTLLNESGFEAKVIDAGVDINDFDKLLIETKKFKPDIIVINTSTITIEDDMYTATFLKEKFSENIVTVLYGIHVSVLYKDVLKSGNKIDFCVIGEPEFTIKELVAAIDKKSDINNVSGLAFLSDSGEIIKTQERNFIKNVDELPIPDWSLVNTDNYRLPLTNEKFLLVNTSRGCPYRCAFCNAYVYYGRKYRHHSVEYVIKELKQNINKFKVKNFMMWAEEFILDKKFVQDLAQAIIDEKLDIKWVCNSRVDAVDEKTLKMIRRAGCWNVAFGIESGVQEILDKIKKDTTLEQIKNAINLTKKAGLSTTGHVIIGFPYDTVETMKETARFIRKLPLDFVQYYCATPYPGTELYEMAKKEAWINTDDWKKWAFNYSVLDYPHLKSNVIMHYRAKFFREYYFKPKIVLNTLKKHVKSPKNLITFAKNIKNFLKWM